ncbi:MAG: hypothetical protein L0H79_12955 [Intrasporangium sp.]|uniref:hypothetical protein n=1 Tax=Intrasporangium sp. TaxID=1925024 RepID=UPI0026487D78|nr:hypothetical protein [Intrasporangium sp.]MDN5796650.1 hypothetical protein [Intrasporangium sp.]
MTIIDAADLRPERVAGGFVRLSAPTHWQTVTEPYPGVGLVVAEPDRDGLFRANLVLAVTEVTMSFADWQKGTDAYLARQQRDYLLLDLEKLPVGGHPGGRRLATYATAENQSVTMEQWTTLVDGRGVTLTVSTGTLAYALHAGRVAGIVASLRIGAGPDERAQRDGVTP